MENIIRGGQAMSSSQNKSRADDGASAGVEDPVLVNLDVDHPGVPLLISLVAPNDIVTVIILCPTTSTLPLLLVTAFAILELYPVLFGTFLG